MFTYILCIETAVEFCSIAIAKNGEILAQKNILEKNKAADIIHILTQEILTENNLEFKNIHAIAISCGPGSYTGLRIATAVAKGFCFALNIPLIAISTLQSMSVGIVNRYKKTDFQKYIPIIDARRMEVFMAELDTQNNFLKQPTAEIVTQEFVEKYKNTNTLFFGNAVEKCEILFQENEIKYFTNFKICATDLCYLANQKYTQNQIEDIAYFEPTYIKAFYTTQKI